MSTFPMDTNLNGRILRSPPFEVDGGMSCADYPRVMKSLRNKIRGARAQTYDFLLGGRGENVRVHVSTGRVLIQCTKTSLSPHRRTAFVQYLVDEGFIPRSFVSSTEDSLPIVEWWMGVKRLSKKTAPGAIWHHRLLFRILGCSLVLCLIGFAAAQIKPRLNQHPGFSPRLSSSTSHVGR